MTSKRYVLSHEKSSSGTYLLRPERFKMNENDFEGTIVLEKLARVDKLEEFLQAVDEDNFDMARSLMKTAGIDEATIAVVLKKMSDPNDEH